MVLFLTSSPCQDDVPEGAELPCILNEENQFVEHLYENWRPGMQCLLISAAPENFESNDEMLDTFWSAFAWHGMTFDDMAVCDARNESDIQELVAESDMIILGGGHVPTQNAFFERMRLRELLRGFSGVVMGISAGSMNCAEMVYAQPELEGEAADPVYQRFIPGLGLTEFMILPHYQMVKDHILDGQRLYEDITYTDSIGRKFYVLPDGSYVLAKDGESWLFGEGYLIQNGEIMKICDTGMSVRIDV